MGMGGERTLAKRGAGGVAEWLYNRLVLCFRTSTIIPSAWLENKPSLYGAYAMSSFTFTLLGVSAWLCFDPVPYPGMKVEATLLILQGIASYGCDVYTFGVDSKWKPVDRISASSLCLWQALKFLWLRMSLAEYVIWFFVLLSGGVCFTNSMAALKGSPGKPPKLQSYLFWHTAWHLSLPVGAWVWMIFRWRRLYGAELS